MSGVKAIMKAVPSRRTVGKFAQENARKAVTVVSTATKGVVCAKNLEAAPSLWMGMDMAESAGEMLFAYAAGSLRQAKMMKKLKKGKPLSPEMATHFKTKMDKYYTQAYKKSYESGKLANPINSVNALVRWQLNGFKMPNFLKKAQA